MNSTSPRLTQGSRRIGRGFNIPIPHPNQFHFKPEAPPHLQNQVSKVANLINQDTATWKSDLILQLYDRQEIEKILKLPLPRFHTPNTQDKLIWPHSMTGEYQVKKAYDLLHKLQTQDNNTYHNMGIHASLWKTLWRLKLSHKILTFTWKILHQALPIRSELQRRGVIPGPKGFKKEKSFV